MKFKAPQMTKRINFRGSSLLKRVDFYFGVPIIFLISLFRRKRTLPTNPKKIGIIVFSAIGDSILSASLLESIKSAFPDIEIIVFSTVANSVVYKLLKGWSQIVVLPIANPIQALRLLFQNPVDILIDTSQWPRIPAIYSAMMSSACTIGFKTGDQFRHYAYDICFSHSNECHEIDNFFKLLNPLQIKGKHLPLINQEAIDAFPLPKFAGENFFVFHPWAGGTKFQMREWPIESWAALANFLINRGFQIVITGGVADIEKTRQLMEIINNGNAVIGVAGEYSLTQTAKLLQSARGVVCVNTGIMHLASIMNIPLVALHGPTNPRRWGPIGAESKVVSVSPENGGQFLNLGFEYPKDAKYLMDKISVTEVINSLTFILNQEKCHA